MSKYIIILLTMFIIGCMLGYLSEVLFRRFVSAKKWVNPGFMHGPWLPLYGFGLVTMFIISATIIRFLPNNLTLYNPNGNLFGNTISNGPTIYDLIPIFIMFIALVLLEFIGGLIFVKGFKVRLWDYTNLKGNILGIICPEFSLIWFIVSVIYYYALNPYLYLMFEELFNFIFNYHDINFIFIFILGIVYGVFILDLVISLNVFNKLIKIIKNSKEIKNYEEFRTQQKQRLLIGKAKLLEMVPNSIKEKYQNKKEELEITKHKFKDFMAKMLLIDPNKKKADNYDSNNRPKKID